MNAEVGLFLLREDLEDTPSSSTTLEGGVGDGFIEDGVDNLLAQQQLAALCVLNNAGYSGGRGGALLCVDALEVLDNGENLGLT